MIVLRRPECAKFRGRIQNPPINQTAHNFVKTILKIVFLADPVADEIKFQPIVNLL